MFTHEKWLGVIFDYFNEKYPNEMVKAMELADAAKSAATESTCWRCGVSPVSTKFDGYTDRCTNCGGRKIKGKSNGQPSKSDGL